MFAVLKTGGKQYKVAPGDILRVEKLVAEAGQTVQFDEILMLGGETARIGDPLVAGAAVQAEVIDQIRGEKVLNFVRRRRKHSSKRTKGHRQYLTLVRVTGIMADGALVAGGASAASAKLVAEVAAERPANLLDAAREGGPDDLKLISGVGPKLESLLHENGVFHFDQIAAWSPAEVAWIDDKLKFKGRIERDDWIGKAAALAAGQNDTKDEE
ncbi:MAG: 50S ribosomal protein L21 [Rhodobacteraceae bacterium]|nr:50S ribosomal protein L21 [Paracoccaceae bacterium]